MTRMANWKSPGYDYLTNVWLKQFPSLQKYISNAFSHMLAKPKTGTIMVCRLYHKTTTKERGNMDPKELQINSMTANHLQYPHIHYHRSTMAAEQRWIKKDCYGCNDQLMINNTMLGNCRKRKKNLSTAWIHYKKAFGSIPHSWFIKCLKVYRVHPMLTSFMESSMGKWKINMKI